MSAGGGVTRRSEASPGRQLPHDELLHKLPPQRHRHSVFVGGTSRLLKKEMVHGSCATASKYQESTSQAHAPVAAAGVSRECRAPQHHRDSRSTQAGLHVLLGPSEQRCESRRRPPSRPDRAGGHTRCWTPGGIPVSRLGTQHPRHAECAPLEPILLACVTLIGDYDATGPRCQNRRGGRSWIWWALVYLQTVGWVDICS